MEPQASAEFLCRSGTNAQGKTAKANHTERSGSESGWLLSVFLYLNLFGARRLEGAEHR